jgi:DNA (cytosine-5)-methyltransferase 1
MPPGQFLIRDIPENVGDWLAAESHRRQLTRKELVLALLDAAKRGESGLPLFDRIVPPVTPIVGGLRFGFVDLFAGIGGMRLGVEAAGGRCLYSSEWDSHCQKTYHSWFGETPAGDLTKVSPDDIPDHDVLVAGFPCQPFSLAGVSKKNSLGHAHGFKDVAQGNLFFTLAAIIEAKRPPALMLENVKNLKSHDKGRTWGVIQSTLDGLGYRIFTHVIDAARFVPQHRERVFIVGFDRQVFGDAPSFTFPPAPSGRSPKFRSILEEKPDPRYTLTDHLWDYLQKYAQKHRALGHGFGFGMVDLDGVSRTLSARYHKDGSEVLIPQPRRNPRRLTPREAARLMGFPDEFPIVVSDTQAYRQFGNAVVPPVAESVAREIVRVLDWHVQSAKAGCLLKSSAQPASRQRTAVGA